MQCSTEIIPPPTTEMPSIQQHQLLLRKREQLNSEFAAYKEARYYRIMKERSTFVGIDETTFKDALKMPRFRLETKISDLKSRTREIEKEITQLMDATGSTGEDTNVDRADNGEPESKKMKNTVEESAHDGKQ